MISFYWTLIYHWKKINGDFFFLGKKNKWRLKFVNFQSLYSMLFYNLMVIFTGAIV